MRRTGIVYIIGGIFSLLLGIGVFINVDKVFNYAYVSNSEGVVDDISVVENKGTGRTVTFNSTVEKVLGTTTPKKDLETTPTVTTSSSKTIHMLEEEKYRNMDFNWESNTGDSENSGGRTTSSRLPASAPRNSDKEVMGFMPYWQLSKYQSLQYDKLTAISYFALTCYDNGEWVTNDPGYTGFYSANFDNMVNLAHQNNTKVYLVVKNFHNRSIRDLVANKNGAGDKLINNIVKVIRDNNLDGVNIDFEYIPDSSYPVTTTLRANFVSWHDKLADRMHLEFPGSVVSTDVFGSSAAGYSAYDIAGLGATSLDYIMFMNYDYITTSCYDGKRIFPMSPLYGNSNWNVSYHLGEAVKKAPAGKILMGIPYYGIDFSIKPSEFSKYNALVNYPNCGGVIETYGSIVDPAFDAYHNPSSIKWNNTDKATWYSYVYNGQYRHGYYDDPKSLSAKYDYARNTKLGGIGIWALGYDAGTNDLWNVLRDKFQRGPFILAFSVNTSNERAMQIISALKLDIVSSVGSNAWKVRPQSGITFNSIKAAKTYPEVVVAEFENYTSGRDIILP